MVLVGELEIVMTFMKSLIILFSIYHWLNSKTIKYGNLNPSNEKTNAKQFHSVSASSNIIL